MSSQLPAVVPKNKWLVGPGGEVTKWSPPPAPLTKHARRAAFRKGLYAVGVILERAGFSSDCDTIMGGQARTISYAKKGFRFDISIKGRSDLARIAYVTSHVGYRYQSTVVGKDMLNNPIHDPTATVRYASDEIKSDQVIQIVAAKTSSIMPIFIELTDDITEPEKHVVRQVIGVLAGVMNDQKALNQMLVDTSKVLDDVQRDVPEITWDDMPGSAED